MRDQKITGEFKLYLNIIFCGYGYDNWKEANLKMLTII